MRKSHNDRHKNALGRAIKRKGDGMSIATDDRGRRRFHGAFTGGFSAGYNNTAGSEAGWQPTTFSSSRFDRATLTKPSNPQDYMDAEDLDDSSLTAIVRHRVSPLPTLLPIHNQRVSAHVDNQPSLPISQPPSMNNPPYIPSIILDESKPWGVGYSPTKTVESQLASLSSPQWIAHSSMSSHGENEQLKWRQIEIPIGFTGKYVPRPISIDNAKLRELVLERRQLLRQWIPTQRSTGVHAVTNYESRPDISNDSLSLSEKAMLSAQLASEFHVATGVKESAEVVRFRAFPSDLAKQRRYDQYVAARDTGKSMGQIQLSAPLHMSSFQQKSEIVDFERLFQTSRVHVGQSRTDIPTDYHDAARKAMFGKLTRRIVEWAPEPLLYKRLGLRCPSSTMVSSSTTKSVPSSDKAFKRLLSEIGLLEEDKPAPSSTMYGSPSQSDSETDEINDLRSVLDKPSSELFNAIFEGVSSSDEDSD